MRWDGSQPERESGRTREEGRRDRVVDVTYAMMSGRPAVPDQYSAEPTNAPCQSVRGTNVATPRAAQSHAAVMTGLRPMRSAR
ncbi:MAG: hypothetical protein AUI15_16270 [Actinobacteria bacterium 13_2_20CM_2_66_6]|nr:MAG: hypothetical protein AUI15_16270 [Actinobacteria bacterium 13_2_20CM_2_66_6]